MGKLHHTNFRSVVLFIFAVLTSILAYSFNPLTQYLSFTSSGIHFLILWGSFISLIFLLISFSLGILAGALYRESILLKAVFWICTILVIVLPQNYSSQLANRIRHDGLISITERLKPLISAIEEFQKHENKLPDSPDELVPKYLSQLPETKSSACEDYKYQTIQEEKAYELWIDVSVGILAFDVFYYSSNGTLPDLPIRPNNYWEPIGNWMYYHD